MAEKPKGLTEDELQSLCSQEETNAIGGIGGELAGQRQKAMSFYLGEKLGNEEEGRSQVVSTEVADTIEWVMPALMKIFTSSEDSVRFDPTGPEDEEQAAQATDYVNWIFNKANKGFLILHDFFKDGLLQKNGVVKTLWEETTEKEKRNVGPIPDEAYTLLLQEIEDQPKGKNKPVYKIVAHTVIKPGDDDYEEAAEKVRAQMAPPMQGPPMQGPPKAPVPPMVQGQGQPPQAAMNPQSVAVAGDGGGLQPGQPTQPPQTMELLPPPEVTGPLHEITVQMTRKMGMVKVYGVPPEEFLISKNARSIDEANYVAHRFRRSLAKLIEDGYDRQKVMDLPTDATTTADTSSEAQTRRDNTGDTTETTSHRQGLLREVWMVEEYVLCDYDGDGIAEYRKVIRASGSSGPILEHEDWEGPPPFSSGSPVLMPHRFTGISLAELVMDLQIIKSQLIRHIIDGAYLSLHPELLISDKVNIDDLLLTKLGKFNRLLDGAKPGDGHVVPMTVPFTGGGMLPLLEYLDSVKENRTGVTRYNQGMDADSLNKTARGITQIMSAAQQRIELIARVFAETGVKDLFRQILRCAQKFQTKEQVIQLRNKWVPMNPREWKSQFNVTVNVGLGTGNQDQVLARLNVLWTSLKEIAATQGQFGVQMVTPENVFNIMKKMIQASGEKSVEQFISEPQPLPPPQLPPDPKMVDAQTKQKVALEQQRIAGEKQQHDHEMAMAKIAADAEANRLKIEAQQESEHQKLIADIAMKRADLGLKEIELNMELRFEREKLAAEIDMKRDVEAQRIEQKGQAEEAKAARDEQAKTKAEHEKTRAASDSTKGDVSALSKTLETVVSSLVESQGKRKKKISGVIGGEKFSADVDEG